MQNVFHENTEPFASQYFFTASVTDFPHLEQLSRIGIPNFATGSWLDGLWRETNSFANSASSEHVAVMSGLEICRSTRREKLSFFTTVSTHGKGLSGLVILALFETRTAEWNVGTIGIQNRRGVQRHSSKSFFKTRTCFSFCSIGDWIPNWRPMYDELNSQCSFIATLSEKRLLSQTHTSMLLLIRIWSI